MNKDNGCKRIIEKNKRIVVAIGISVMVMVCLLLCFYARYSSGLDIYMQSLIYGTFTDGKASSELIFSNVILGSVLKGLVSITGPAIPWYTVAQYISVFVGVVCINYAIICHVPNKMGYIIAVVLNCCIGYAGFIRPTYARTSVILVAGGAVLLLAYLDDENNKCRIRMILSIIIMVSGFLFSAKIAAAAFCISVVMILFYRIISGTVTRRIGTAIICFGIAVVLAAGTYVVDYQSVKDNNMLSENILYRDAYEKNALLGYAPYSPQVYEMLGIEEADYAYIASGVFVNADSNRFNMQIAIAKLHRAINAATAKAVLKQYPKALFSVGLFYCWLLIAVLIVLFNRKHIIQIIISYLGIMIVIGSLYVLHSSNWQLIFDLILIPVCTVFAMSLDKVREEDWRTILACVLVGGVILCSRFGDSFVRRTNRNNPADIFAGLDTNTTYLIDMESLMDDYSVFVKYPVTLGQLENVYVFNSSYSMNDENKFINTPGTKLDGVSFSIIN